MTNTNEDAQRKASIDAREDSLRNRKKDLDFENRKLEVELREVELERRNKNLDVNMANLKKRELEFDMELQDENSEDLIAWTAYKRGFLKEPSLRENELEKSGDINALQRYRRDRYFYELDLHGCSDPLAVLDVLETERQLRETAQKMMRLRDQIEQNKQEVEDLQKICLYLERQWGEKRSAFCDGPLTRAFDLWRSHPRWYMHRVLREDCAARGGCCSRECGCCLDRNLGSALKHAAGHCTAECGCCREAEGSALSETKELELRYALSGVETKDLQMEFSVPQEGWKNQALQHVLSEEEKTEILREYVLRENKCESDGDYEPSEAEFTDGEESCEEDYYHNQMFQASIWGLMIGNRENPFDLIDETPRYGETIAPTREADDGNADSFSLVDHDADSMMTETV
jgi:hypothetical protein